MHKLGVLSALLAFPCYSQTPQAAFHIGNSLTWDASPEAQVLFAERIGQPMIAGYHIHCGNGLLQIMQSPSSTCINPVESFGWYRNALAHVELSYITAQPYWTFPSTMETDLLAFAVFEDLLDQVPSNSDTRIYLYQAWGSRSFMSGTDWGAPVADDDQTPTTLADEYFVHLFLRLEAETDRDVHLIPTGRVIRRAITEGVATVSQLYRDDIHLSRDIGSFLASVTMFCVTHNCPPFGLHETWIASGRGQLRPADYRPIESVIWAVISTDERTGVNACLVDVNRDDIVSPADFSAWIAAFNRQLPGCDQNGDAMCTPADFSAWIANYNTGCP